MSGYGLANTQISVYRGVQENAFGDPEHRLDPDAVIAKNIPATVSSRQKSTFDTTTQTPRTVDLITVQIGAAANKRVPDGGIKVGDLLLDQRRQESFAVKTDNTPYAVGRPSPDRVFELDRLS